jgi:hypothetical protein
VYKLDALHKVSAELIRVRTAVLSRDKKLREITLLHDKTKF